MSRQISCVPEAATFDRRVTPAMYRMLGAIGTWANRDGWAWPKLETIATRMGIEVPAVSKMLRKLEAVGYLQMHYETRNGRRRVVCRVIFDRPVETAAAITDDEYDAGLEDERPPVSLKETQEKSPVSSKETDTFPQKETDTFPQKETVLLMNSPEEQPRGTPLADASPSPVAEVIGIWNAMAADAKLPRARETAKRRRDITRRLQDAGWLEDFRAACLAIAASPWHRGANDRGWVATLDFLLQSDKATTLAERASAKPVAAVPSAGALEELDVGGGQRMSVSVFWRVCTDAGLAAPMQTADMIREGVERLHARGTVQDPHAFTALVLHVNPAKLAEITFGKEREMQLRNRLASWRPMAGAA